MDYLRFVREGRKIETSSPVTALVITYAPQAGVLKACIDSLMRQEPRPHIVIADNFSESDSKHEIALSFRAENVTVITFSRNLGFGGAINKILPYIKSPFVLISNFDIVYDPSYLKFAVWKLNSSEADVVGIAGKTLFYPPNADERWPGRGPNDKRPVSGRGTGAVIDNAGTLVNGLMLAYNRGVGQIDIGQYDVPDRPMGACFAAFLARTSAFNRIQDGGVGNLDETYFMYYEDIDWCYRANALGKQILYEPRAIAWHHHSLTTRDLPVFFKYHLIQRNLYRTIEKNMKFRTVLKLHALHARLHIRRAKVERNFAPVTAKILGEMLLWFPVGLLKRSEIQKFRKISDTEIVNLSIGEEGHLDDLSLRPKTNWANPLASLYRLQKNFPDEIPQELITLIEYFAEGKGSGRQFDELIELLETHCQGLIPLIRQIP